MPEQPMTIEEVATRANVTKDTVRRWLRTGRLKGKKLGPSAQDHWRVARNEVEELLGGLDGQPSTGRA